MNDSCVLGRDAEGFVSVGGSEHPVAQVPQRFDRELANERLIFFNEHRFGTLMDRGSDWCGHGGRDFGRHLRQVDVERRALSDDGVQRTGSAALLDDPVHSREAKACPFAALLSGEERLKDVPGDLGIHSGTSVRDGEHD